MKYSDFEIWATDVRSRTTNGEKHIDFQVRTKSPAGERIEGTPTGYDAGEIRKQLAGWDTRQLGWDDVMALGMMLGSILFPDAIRELWARSLNMVRAQGKGVRLRLLLDDRLQHIPWEYALLPQSGGAGALTDFLGLMPDVSIARHQAVGLPPWEIKAEVPARILVVLAGPERYPYLHLPHERRNIEEALRDNPRVEAVFVPGTTPDTWGDTLEQAHLFHFAGHGDLPVGAVPGPGRGVLVFADEENEPALVEAGTLAVRLRQLGVRVAVLGACQSGRRDEANPWGSVASALLQAGLSAIVAMQHQVRDDTAIAFSGVFYKALLAGLTIDEAVTYGRLAVFDSDARGWATPVLYLRAPDGVVFPEYGADPALGEERKQLRAHVSQQAVDVHGKLAGVRVRLMKQGHVEVVQDLGTVGEDGEVVGADIGKAENGSVDVDQKANTVSGDMTGASIDEL